MTQALINNYNILNEAACKTDNYAAKSDLDTTKTYGADKQQTNDFKQILDKTTEKNDFTLENTKSNSLNRDISEKIQNFKEILEQATDEANMEKSLDLTLARDIAEIIAQLTGTVELNLNTDLNTDSSEFSDTLANETEITVNIDEDAAIAKFVDVNTDEESNNSTLSLDKDLMNELNIESVSSEADNSGQGTMTNQETAEEFGVKVMLNQISENFDINLEKMASNNTVKTTDVTPEKIIEQLTKHLDSFKLNSKVNIVLNPEHLGKLNLQILNSKDGLSAQFTVTTNEARELLMKGLDGLKESLLSQGINVDNISVKISESEKSEYNPDWLEQDGSEKQEQQGNRQYKEKEKGLFEKTIAENLEKENGNV